MKSKQTGWMAAVSSAKHTIPFFDMDNLVNFFFVLMIENKEEEKEKL